jgi:hypothetical protein
LALKLNDLQDESVSLKKKHASNTKDLTNQLQKLHKQLEQQQQQQQKVKQSNETTSSRNNVSRSNSMCSLDKEDMKSVNESISSGDSNHNNNTNQHSDVYVVDVDKQKIIEKVVKLQKMLAKKTEKIDFLQDHVNQLTNDLKKKSK